MTKKGKILSGQMELNLYDEVRRFSALTSQIEKDEILTGSLDISKEFCAALKADMEYARDENGRPLSRAQIAERMSKFLGVRITEGMTYNWTAPSHPHSLPAKYFHAFVQATGGQRRAVEVFSKHSNLYLQPGEEALRSEIQRLDEEEKRIRAEKQKRLLYLKMMEGK